jgi:hypothetical protein
MDSLVAGLTPAFWSGIGVAAVFGALGGLIYELILLRGAVEWPHRPRDGEVPKVPYIEARYLWSLGVASRLVIGAGAALAVMAVITPDTTLKLVATSLIAGSAGTSVFRSMQDRLIATLAQHEVDTVRDEAGRALNGVNSALEELRLQTEARRRVSSAKGSEQPIELESGTRDLGQVARLLEVARTTLEGVTKARNPS